MRLDRRVEPQRFTTARNPINAMKDEIDSETT